MTHANHIFRNAVTVSSVYVGNPSNRGSGRTWATVAKYFGRRGFGCGKLASDSLAQNSIRAFRISVRRISRYGEVSSILRAKY